MKNIEWRPFDYDNRKKTAPPKELHDELVWIHEEHYHGVTLGYYDHGGWWCTWTGSDDCSVSHWAPLEKPDPPEDTDHG